MISVDVGYRIGSFSLAAAFGNGEGITALFGRSGSGKSTLIGLIAGLRRPQRGRISLDGRVLVDTAAGVFVPAHRRRIGVVYQDARLFPHLSVRHNLDFGHWFAPRGERRIPFAPVIDTLGIGHLLDRRPAALSGGEKQRVALGRALLASPRLLLMDEPLASLDMPRRLEILPLIERLRDEFGIPIVYVSHAVEEVARLAARVVILDAGEVTAIGTPAEVLMPTPLSIAADRFEAASVIDVTVGRFDPRYGLTALAHPAGTVHIAGQVGPEGREARIVVRAIDVALATRRPDHISIRTSLTATVVAISGDGNAPMAAVTLALTGRGRLTALATRKSVDELDLGIGQAVFALVKTVALDERPLASQRAADSGRSRRGPR